MKLEYFFFGLMLVLICLSLVSWLINHLSLDLAWQTQAECYQS